MNAVTVAMLTCGRLELFRRTMSSFFSHVQDAHLIRDWIVINNGSTDEDIDTMQREFPALRGKFLDGRGYTYRQVRENLFRSVETPLVFTMEDDWEFYRAGTPILEALDIMGCDARIKGVAFRYFPCPVAIGKKRGKGRPVDVPYRLHEYRGHPGPRPDSYDCHWLGFTWNPAIHDVDAIRRCMPFQEPRVERHVAARWAAHGNLMAHTFKGYVRHIGHEQSAFDISGNAR